MYIYIVVAAALYFLSYRIISFSPAQSFFCLLTYAFPSFTFHFSVYFLLN